MLKPSNGFGRPIALCRHLGPRQGKREAGRRLFQLTPHLLDNSTAVRQRCPPPRNPTPDTPCWKLEVPCTILLTIPSSPDSLMFSTLYAIITRYGRQIHHPAATLPPPIRAYSDAPAAAKAANPTCAASNLPPHRPLPCQTRKKTPADHGPGRKKVNNAPFARARTYTQSSSASLFQPSIHLPNHTPFEAILLLMLRTLLILTPSTAPVRKPFPDFTKLKPDNHPRQIARLRRLALSRTQYFHIPCSITLPRWVLFAGCDFAQRIDLLAAPPAHTAYEIPLEDPAFVRHGHLWYDAISVQILRGTGT